MTNRIEALERVLERAPYFEYLCRHVSQIGFVFEKGCEIVRLAGKSNREAESLVQALGLSSSSNIGIVDTKSLSSCEEAKPEVWVEMNELELFSLLTAGESVSKLGVTITNEGALVHPKVETIVQRIFMPSEEKKFPISDRVELIYGALFNFIEPKVVWTSNDNELIVLKYESAFEGLDVFITSGFSNPEKEHSKIEFDQGSASGYGYELMILASPEDLILKRELVSWTKYVYESGQHIYPGQYLEYQEALIPGTDLTGFIIVPPLEFPEILPVGEGYCRLNLFIGVTGPELGLAKEEDDVYVVAEQLMEQGYVNYSPVRRESVV
jgi:hypothetical protein